MLFRAHNAFDAALILRVMSMESESFVSIQLPRYLNASHSFTGSPLIVMVSPVEVWVRTRRWVMGVRLGRTAGSFTMVALGLIACGWSRFDVLEEEVRCRRGEVGAGLVPAACEWAFQYAWGVRYEDLGGSIRWHAS